MPVGIRTCYTYIDKGFAGVSNIDLPRKVRYKPRKRKKEPGRDRVDRTVAAVCSHVDTHPRPARSSAC